MPWDIWHAGELAAQDLAGTRDEAAELQGYLRPAMPQQHADFFATQSLMYLGSRDGSGQPWASALAGPQGFVSAPDPGTITISNYVRIPGDPALLGPGSYVAGLGLEHTTRRRNRVNGRVLSVGAAGGEHGANQGGMQGGEKGVGEQAGPPLHLEVDLSFGNCPKYIQVRDVRVDLRAAARATHGTPAVRRDGATRGSGEQLRPEQLALIAAADTFFIATWYGGGRGEELPNAVGCDVSHRGGPPGFVQVEADPSGGPLPTLRWAEYSGNNFFNTLGNLQTDPRAGLLFIDYASGTTLQLAGTASVDFGDTSLPGAQRSVRFVVQQFLHVPHALPLAVQGAVQYSSYLPKGVPEPGAQRWVPKGAAVAAEDGVGAAVAGQGAAVGPAAQEVEVVRVTDAAEGIKTFEFRLPEAVVEAAAAAGRTPYLAGQYAVFELPADQLHPADARQAAALQRSGATLMRTWTVTSSPQHTLRHGTFCITVKRAGLVSAHLHDRVTRGSRLAWVGFEGEFTPERALAFSPPGSEKQAVQPEGRHQQGEGEGRSSAGGSAGVGGGGGGDERVALLVAGGIGITPIWAALQDLAHRAGQAGAGADGAAGGAAGGDAGAGARAVPAAPVDRVVVVYSVRHAREAAFLAEMAALAGAAGARTAAVPRGAPLQVQVLFLTTGDETDRASAVDGQPGGAHSGSQASAVTYNRGRLTAAALAAVLGPHGVAALRGGRCRAMVCGPNGFMSAVEHVLVKELGMPAEHLSTESFNY